MGGGGGVGVGGGGGQSFIERFKWPTGLKEKLLSGLKCEPGTSEVNVTSGV